MNFSGKSAKEFERGVAGLMRYYWFRMSDSLLPVGLALGIIAWLSRLQAMRPVLGNWLLMAAILLAAANVADVGYWRSRRPLPGAILQPKPTADSAAAWWFRSPSPNPQAVTAAQWAADWKSVCRWIDANTSRDAKFFTPHEQQTFKWYANRAEVANWKDVPQDAEGLVFWKYVMDVWYPRQRRRHKEGLAAESDENLAMLGRAAVAQYIVIDHTRSRRAIGLPRVYPLVREDNPSFSVYRVPELKSP